MNKKLIIILLVMVSIVIYFYNNNFQNSNHLNNKQMWISSDARHISHISTTSNVDEINRVLHILDSLEWHEGVLDCNNKADYGFWISRESHEERIVNCDVWIKEENIIILDIKTRKHVINNNNEVNELISIIEEVLNKK